MDQKGSTVITWTGKKETLTGVSGITRVYGKAAVITARMTSKSSRASVRLSKRS